MENGDLTDNETEKEYDLLPKVVKFFEENGHKGEDISKVELSINQEGLKQEESILNEKAEKIESPKPEDVNGKLKDDENKEKDELVKIEFKMLESFKIEKKEFSPEREQEPESFVKEINSKIEGGNWRWYAEGKGCGTRRRNSDENGQCGAAKTQPQGRAAVHGSAVRRQMLRH
ncbi:hypothetical protein SESBI_43961 [Sesbania bispinosa]|nr:hypothetical protein SESBI_43961 [Sesbania bispinosa]